MVSLIRLCYRLRFHLRVMKTLTGEMLLKSNKVDNTSVKSYQVISIFNYLGKVCKKIATDKLADW